MSGKSITRSIGLVVTAIAIAIASTSMVRSATQPNPAPPTTATEPSVGSAKEITLDLGGEATLKLMLIPPGKFLMGSPKNEKGRGDNEVQHEVTISKSFYLGVTHVTVDQFASFVKDSGYKTDAEKEGSSYRLEIRDGIFDAKKVTGHNWHTPIFEQTGSHPVVQVSWNDAQAFCDWLSKKSRRNVRLPTEAQWEYACRAGTTTAYPWGDNPDDGKGCVNGADESYGHKLPNDLNHLSPLFRFDDGFVFTSPVANLKANAFGLYDMLGNAGEFCQDIFWYYDEVPATNPTGPTKAPMEFRVVRGGSWHAGQEGCRSASRSMQLPSGRSDNEGFRVAVIVTDNDHH